MKGQKCHVCNIKMLKTFKCKDCGSIICMKCGEYYNDSMFCMYCESDIANVNYNNDNFKECVLFYYKSF